MLGQHLIGLWISKTFCPKVSLMSMCGRRTVWGVDLDMSVPTGGSHGEEEGGDSNPWRAGATRSTKGLERDIITVPNPLHGWSWGRGS